MPGTLHTDDCICDNCYHLVDMDMGPPSDAPDIVDLMVEWFFQNFEDPAQNTPWDHGYVYIWGGPYNARDELEDEFGDVVAPHAIEKAVDKIEEEGAGPEWAPSHNRMRPE